MNGEKLCKLFTKSSKIGFTKIEREENNNREL